MNSRVAEYRLKKALAPLNATEFKLISCESDLVTFRVVSSEFQGVPMLRRFQRTQALISAQDEYLYDKFCLIMECFTPDEWKVCRIEDIGHNKKKASTEDHRRRVRIAKKLGRL